MTIRTCSIGYAICKDLGLSHTYDQCNILPVTRFLCSTIEPQRQHMCHVPQYTSSKLPGAHVKHPTKNKNQCLRLQIKCVLAIALTLISVIVITNNTIIMLLKVMLISFAIVSYRYRNYYCNFCLNIKVSIHIRYNNKECVFKSTCLTSSDVINYYNVIYQFLN